MTRQEAADLHSLLSKFVVDHAASPRVAKAVDILRPVVQGVFRRLVEKCPWCGTIITAENAGKECRKLHASTVSEG